MDRQSQRLSEYCAKHNLYTKHIIKDVGSELNDNRNGFVRLTNLIINKQVNKLIIEHKDRLTRFQFSFIKWLKSNKVGVRSTEFTLVDYPTVDD